LLEIIFNRCWPALILLDSREETIEIAEVRYVSLDAGNVLPDLLCRSSHLRITASRDENVRAFVHEALRRRKANAAVRTRDERNFSVELTHLFFHDPFPFRSG
jgi:hypothetical protein